MNKEKTTEERILDTLIYTSTKYSDKKVEIRFFEENKWYAYNGYYETHSSGNYTELGHFLTTEEIQKLCEQKILMEVQIESYYYRNGNLMKTVYMITNIGIAFVDNILRVANQ